MTKIEKVYDSCGNHTEMKDEEVEKLVEECLQGKSTVVREMDTIVSLRKGRTIVDVFTIVRHRIYEPLSGKIDEVKFDEKGGSQ